VKRAADPPAPFEIHARCGTAAETRALGASLAGACRPGDTLLLVGGLGAGKTTFAQGFASGLGVAGPVTSPTFTLVRQYRADGRRGITELLHADVYRLDHLHEVADLALPELVERAAIALVEWGDAAAPVLGDDPLTIELTLAELDERLVTVRGGPGWTARRVELEDAVTGKGDGS
jgi:tRNA threonylcarbamoyladenosine biosynthesis protein TsaE